MNYPPPEFVFLGFSTDCVEILERAVAIGGRCSGIYVDDAQCVPENHQATTRVLGDWAELLAADSNVNLFVALSLKDDSHQDIVRSLVSNGSSLIFVDPDADSLFAYELEMIRTESDTELSTICFEGLSADDLGPVSQINIRESAITRHLKTITSALTRDLLQLRAIVGESKYLYALSPGTSIPISPAAELDISITLEMRNGTIVQWSNSDKSHALTQYTFSNEQRINPSRSFSSETTATQLSTIFASGINDISPTWLEYAKARETAEMIPLSLKRGRQIELFNTHPTETDAFKGVMSGAGCFLLLLTLGVLGLFATFDTMRLSDLRDLHQTAQSIPTTDLNVLFRLWPVYPLLLFLSFQFLRGIIKKAKRSSTA
jgi:outer membrane lipoprotein-sorting protein